KVSTMFRHFAIKQTDRDVFPIEHRPKVRRSYACSVQSDSKFFLSGIIEPLVYPRQRSIQLVEIFSSPKITRFTCRGTCVALACPPPPAVEHALLGTVTLHICESGFEQRSGQAAGVE